MDLPIEDSPIARYLSDRIVDGHESGCWIWTGPTKRDGAPVAHGPGCTKNGRAARRLVWQLLRPGTVPPRNSACIYGQLCVRPSHQTPRSSHLDQILQDRPLP